LTMRCVGASCEIPAMPRNPQAKDSWTFHPPAEVYSGQPGPGLNNPAIVKLPMCSTGTELEHLTLLVELTATVRRRRPVDPLDLFDEDTQSGMARPGPLTPGPMLSHVLRQRGGLLVAPNRTVTWDWGKGMTVFESDKKSPECLFVPLGDVTEVRMSTWRRHSFLIGTATEHWEFDCDSGGTVEKYVNTIKEDIIANEGVVAGTLGTMEVHHMCMGWVEIDMSDVPLELHTLPISGGTIAAPTPIKKTNIPQRSGMMSWFTPECVMKLTVGSVGRGSPLSQWVPRLPGMGCAAAGAVPMLVLYRQAMGDKMWEDSASLHWSLTSPSSDPLLKWVPDMVDQDDTFCALWALWRAQGMSVSALAAVTREQVDRQLELLRRSVLLLYPALAGAPPPRLDDLPAMKERADRLAYYLNAPSMDTILEASELCAPFHTSELISDAIDGLAPPMEVVYGAPNGAGHYGDPSRREITLLIGRLVDLLERGLGTNSKSKKSERSFYSFFDSALPKSAIRNLMQWNMQSLEEVDAAFRAKGLRHSPQGAHEVLLGLQKAESQAEFVDPYHAMMTTANNQTVHFLSTADAPGVWYMSADFFFKEH